MALASQHFLRPPLQYADTALTFQFLVPTSISLVLLTPIFGVELCFTVSRVACVELTNRLLPSSSTLSHTPPQLFSSLLPALEFSLSLASAPTRVVSNY